jgi:acetyl-CoA synthetase
MTFVRSLFLVFAVFSYAEQATYFNDEFAKKARVNDQSLFEEAENDRIAFWEKCASELSWFEKWDKALTWNPPFAKWFEGGKLNISYNCLDRHVEANLGEKIALIHIDDAGKKQVVTYQQLSEEVNKLSNAMKKLGVKRGDRVAIYMPMVPEGIASMLACTRIGAVHTVIFGGIGAGSVKERILDAEAALLITADGSYRGGKKVIYKNGIDAVLEECACLNSVLVFNNIGESYQLKEGRDFSYQELVAKQSSYFPPEEMDSEDPLFILYTSGTTGKPKGIFHTTGGYLTGVYQTFKWVFDICQDDIFWCTADIGWITGHSYVIYGPLSNGATQVIFEGGFDYPQKNRFAKIIDENNVSIFYTAPTLVRMFMQWGEECLRGAKLGSLRLLGSIGEPINPESWQWFYENIGHQNCPIVDTWFQTETGALVISPLPGLTPLKPGSITKPLPGYDVAVLDEEGNPASRGFLAITSPYPSMMRGIYKDPQRYKDTYWCKWDGKHYYAGDVASIDEDGYIRVGGRSDEVLKVAGHRIGTAEIENALIESPLVAESAVIGAKDALKGQKIVAFVVLRQGVEAGPELEKELKKLVSDYVGAYARPARVVVVNHLPKTRSGKILRRVLKNLVEGEAVGNVTTLNDPSIMPHLVEVCGKLNEEFYLQEVNFSKISAIPKLLTTPTEKNGMEREKLQAVLKPVLEEHLASLNYDRTHLADAFLSYYQQEKAKRPTLLPLKAMEEFDCELNARESQGGICFSLVDDLYNHLPDGVFGYKVMATVPNRFYQDGFPKFCHAGVVVPFNEGVMLLEPNFDLAEPIILLEGQPVLVDMKDKGKWVFCLSGQKISVSESENTIMEYHLADYINGMDVGPKAMASVDEKMSLVSRDSEGYHLGHLNVNLKTEQVQLTIQYEKKSPIPFEDFLQGQELDDDVAALFHLQPRELNGMIQRIILGKEVFSTLKKQYLKVLDQHPRKEEFIKKNGK